MENKMNYTKATLLLVSGIVAITAMFLLGRENSAYGFLLGYGYTAVISGLIATIYTYFKNQKARKRSSV